MSNLVNVDLITYELIPERCPQFNVPVFLNTDISHRTSHMIKRLKFHGRASTSRITALSRSATRSKLHMKSKSSIWQHTRFDWEVVLKQTQCQGKTTASHRDHRYTAETNVLAPREMKTLQSSHVTTLILSQCVCPLDSALSPIEKQTSRQISTFHVWVHRNGKSVQLYKVHSSTYPLLPCFFVYNMNDHAITHWWPHSHMITNIIRHRLPWMPL